MERFTRYDQCKVNLHTLTHLVRGAENQEVRGRRVQKRQSTEEAERRRGRAQGGQKRQNRGQSSQRAQQTQSRGQSSGAESRRVVLARQVSL